jgi:hypothetical protein
MTIETKMINECKRSVINVLEEYFGATEEEITLFSNFIENEDPENWTCESFEEELLPLFKEIRKKANFTITK